MMLLARYYPAYTGFCPADNCGMVGESGGTLLIPDLHRRSVGGTTP